jgi:uncharacterized protein (DUF1697 family)
MAVVISMLRGVNLGSRNRIKMDVLRALYESLDLQEPQTYVQSGNVIFRTRERDLVRLAKRIENGIEQVFKFHADVVLRTPSALRDAIAKNPFRTRSDIDPSKLLFVFLVGDPGAQAREKILDMKIDPEELWIDGRELYLYFPDGMARPKLSWTAIEKIVKTSWTGRNANSVKKLLEIAEAMEGREHS